MTRKQKATEIKQKIEEELDELGVYCGPALVELIIGELEAAGQVWDPEELQLDAFSSEQGGWRIVHAGSGAMHPFTQAQTREIIRRYEAWPKLRERVEPIALSSCPSQGLAKAILAILDGKEE